MEERKQAIVFFFRQQNAGMIIFPFLSNHFPNTRATLLQLHLSEYEFDCRKCFPLLKHRDRGDNQGHELLAFPVFQYHLKNQNEFSFPLLQFPGEFLLNQVI